MEDPIEQAMLACVEIVSRDDDAFTGGGLGGLVSELCFRLAMFAIPGVLATSTFCLFCQLLEGNKLGGEFRNLLIGAGSARRFFSGPSAKTGGNASGS